MCSPTQTIWPQMESSGEGRGAVYVVESSVLWLHAGEGQASTLLPVTVFTARDSALPSVSIDNTAVNAQARLVSSDLCGTASDLNLVAHWFGFRNRDDPEAFPREREACGVT